MPPSPGSTESPTRSYPISGGTERVAVGWSTKLHSLAQVEALAPDVILVRSEEHRVVLAASTRLKPVDQEILRLTLWEELSHADIAVVLGIEVTAVKQRAYRARQNLADEYRKLTGDRKPPAARKGGGS